jgi:hypothetical protein
MIKKVIILTIIGAIAYWAFGWFVFDYVLGAYTERNTTQIPGFKKTAEQFSMPLLVLSCSAYAALIVYILAVLSKTKNTIEGAVTGAIVGILVAIMTDSYWLVSSNFYNNVYVALADVAAAGVSVGFLGFVVTFLSNKIGD